ncbi:MAG: hypothetical protein LUQ13_04565, partial [Methanomicrobiales archaeon]|nr:hypothetical protein [Methanomicrobiales archaeon]
MPGGNVSSTISPPLLEDPMTILYFNSPYCGACQETSAFFATFSARYPAYAVLSYNIYEPQNLQRFEALEAAYHTGMIGVPTIFHQGHFVTGAGEIRVYVEGLVGIASNETSPPPTPPPTPPMPTPGTGGLTVPTIISAALLDGINPCALAVLAFLLGSITVAGSRRGILVVGAVYIGGVFTFYFLSGIGLFASIQYAGVNRIFSLAAGVIALVVGVISIHDGLTAQPHSVLSIPGRFTGVIARYARTGAVPTAAVLGILVGMFELPCTGGIYLAILGLMSSQMSLATGMSFLLLYNIVFVLPLIAVLLLVAFGIPPDRIQHWRLGQRRSLRILMGCIMIALGVYVITSCLCT